MRWGCRFGALLASRHYFARLRRVSGNPGQAVHSHQASGLIPLYGSLWVRRLLRPSPGVGGVKFECRCQPSRQRAQRPGLDRLNPAPFLALGQNGECGEELSERRIRASQVPLDCAQGPPMAQSQIHRDGHELNQAGQNHSASRRDRRPARDRPVRGITLGCHRPLPSVARLLARARWAASLLGAGRQPVPVAPCAACTPLSPPPRAAGHRQCPLRWPRLPRARRDMPIMRSSR